jgi:hypothetical protein
MNTGLRLGLVLLYVVIAGNIVLMLRIFVQILFRAAIEKHRRRQFTEKNGGAAYPSMAFGGKRGWANIWLPRIAFGLAWTVAAQQRTGCEVSASTLKQQWLDLESKETRLRIRLEELGEQLKPESIERELAGIGSTHPEELREHRRKLLTIERNGLQRQLDLLEEERVRIEAAIATAETASNLEYAQPSPSPLVITAPPKPTTEMISLSYFRIAELPLQKLSVVVAMLVLLGGGFILLLMAARSALDVRRRTKYEFGGN